MCWGRYKKGEEEIWDREIEIEIEREGDLFKNLKQFLCMFLRQDRNRADTRQRQGNRTLISVKQSVNTSIL